MSAAERARSPRAAVLLRHVGFGYAGASESVLDDISLEVEDGEFLVILGPSGCGKSTLLKLVSGYLKPSAGEIVASRPDGKPVRTNSVFQDSGLYPWMTVVDNVAFGLRMRGMPRAERRQKASRELEKVGLSHVSASYPSRLSGGMRQRVNIARAMANDPDIVLMDEPFAALDVQTRLLMQEETLRLVQQAKRTILFVTHSIEEALVLGDRVVVLGAYPGRVKQIIDVPFEKPRNPAEVRTDARYAHLYDHAWGLIRDEARSAFLKGAV